jgi:hypothetical protein
MAMAIWAFSNGVWQEGGFEEGEGTGPGGTETGPGEGEEGQASRTAAVDSSPSLSLSLPFSPSTWYSSATACASASASESLEVHDERGEGRRMTRAGGIWAGRGRNVQIENWLALFGSLGSGVFSEKCFLSSPVSHHGTRNSIPPQRPC